MCREYGLQPDSQLERLIRQNTDLVDACYIANPKVGEFLFSLLRHPQSEIVLHLMHESGLLARLVPEFGRSQFLIRHDFYHRYTVDEHALRMVHFLEGLPDAADEGLAKFQEPYAESEEDRVMLKLACLLHSLGREGEKSSASKTREALSRVFEHFALTPEQQSLLVFFNRPTAHAESRRVL